MSWRIQLRHHVKVILTALSVAQITQDEDFTALSEKKIKQFKDQLTSKDLSQTMKQEHVKTLALNQA